MKPRLTLLLLTLMNPSLAAAQERPCFESQDHPPWNTVGVDADTGASRTTSGGVEVELCSQSLGLAEHSDSYRGLMRGVMGDYSLTATLVEVDPDSSAGLLLSADTRLPDAAHFFIVAERVGAAPTVLVRSGFRPSRGSASTAVDAESVEATLPLTLRLSRDHGVLMTSIVDTNGETYQLAVPVAGGALSAWGQLGLMQAGTSYVAESRARFGTPQLQFSFVPPAEVDCVGPTTMPQSGGTMTFTGRGFDRVHGVSLGDDELSVLRASDEALTVTLPAGGTRFGKLTFDLGDVDQVTPRTIAVGGSPFVRGDLNGDTRVDSVDLKALRQATISGVLPECRASADINADGMVNSLDDAQLNAFLGGRRGAKPPAAPFPAPGIVPGLPACGLPAGPVVQRLLNVDGTSIATPLAQGSIVRLEGSDLPPHPVVRFGGVVAKVQSGATATRIDVMLGVVPSAGRRCLVVQSGAEAVAGQPTFGLAYGAAASERPDLCLDLSASRLGFAAEAVAAADGALFLPIDAARWTPDLALRVSVNLAFPLVEGASRGPRSASFAFTHNPPLEDGTAPVTYASWLDALAVRTAKALGAEDDCDCEAEVVPAPLSGGLWIKPCFLTTPVPPPPPLPPGTVPGGLSLKAARPSLGAANAYALPLEPSCETLAGGGTARQIAWCHLAQITAIRTEPSDPNDVNDSAYYVGLPRWEGFRPMTAMDTLDNSPWVVDPRDQSPEQKKTLVEQVLAEHLLHRGYFNACAIAARSAYCGGAKMSWMPNLPAGTRIVKAFWRKLSQLPQSADVSTFYSYHPMGFERQYLVGMHVSVGTGFGFGGPEYLSWATFWMPKAPGETLNKAGGPLSQDYNDNCFAGGPDNRPEELVGTPWGNFHMCVQGFGGEHCGNPWGPADECTPEPEPYLDQFAGEGCAGCHEARTKIGWGADAPDVQDPYMRMGWMTVPTNIGDAARTCMAEIVAGKKKGQSPHENDAYCGSN